MPKKKETIMVFAAHNDDHVIGAGGTLAKYAKEGKRVITIVFSYGETSHPHLKPKVIMERRYRESIESENILGTSGIFYLGLKEGKFLEQYKKLGLKKKLANIINEERPSKIFTLGPGDAHPDHKAVAKIVMELVQSKKIKCGVYAFEVWSAIKTRKRTAPKLVVDVSDTFKTKVKAVRAHKSQFQHISPFMFVLLLKMWIDAVIAGWNNNCKFAEVFPKLNY